MISKGVKGGGLGQGVKYVLILCLTPPTYYLFAYLPLTSYLL